MGTMCAARCGERVCFLLIFRFASTFSIRVLLLYFITRGVQILRFIHMPPVSTCILLVERLLLNASRVMTDSYHLIFIAISITIV